MIALVHTKDCTDTEDFVRVPRIEVAHIEGAFSEADADEVRALLTRLHDDRVRHIKQPLDLPDTDDTVVEEPLALEAGDVIDAELVDDDNPLALTTGEDD